jgi:hypothetical protein
VTFHDDLVAHGGIDRAGDAGQQQGARIALGELAHGDLGQPGQDVAVWPRPRGAHDRHPLGAGKVRSDGTLLFMSSTGDRRPAAGVALAAALTSALPALVKTLALEVAPVRVNLIAAGSAGPADVAALAVYLMTNTAITGATIDIDGGQQPAER